MTEATFFYIQKGSEDGGRNNDLQESIIAVRDFVDNNPRHLLRIRERKKIGLFYGVKPR